MTKEAYYFSHDTNARRDPKILAMRSQLGDKSYGWYWMLIEILAEQEGYTIAHKSWAYYGLAMDMLCDAKEVESFITRLIHDFELLESDGLTFWSPSLLKRMELKEAKRDKRIEAGKKGARSRWGKPTDSKEIVKTNENDDSIAIALPLAPVSNPNADLSSTNAVYGKGKERKGKESKGNKSSALELKNDPPEKKEPKTDPDQPRSRSSSQPVNVHRFYQENIGVESSYIVEDLEQWVTDLNPDLVLYALQKTVENNGSYAYAKSILKDWAKTGIHSLDQAKAETLGRQRKQFKAAGKIEKLPDWAQSNPPMEPDEKVSAAEVDAFQEKLRQIRGPHTKRG